MAIILFRTADGRRTDGGRTDGRSDRDYKAKPGQLGWAGAGPELGKNLDPLIRSQIKNGSTEAGCSLDVIEIEPYCKQSYLRWVKILFKIFMDR